jgi:thiol-disulfide isomerase/thioredoxin
MSKKIIFILTVVLASILIGCSSESQETEPVETATEQTQAQPTESPSSTGSLMIRPGYEFAGMTGTTLEDREVTAKLFSSSRLSLVNIWTTTCPYCIEEMPDLQEVSQMSGQDDVQVVGIVGDGRYNPQRAREIVEKTGVTYVNVSPSPSFEKTVQSIAYAVPTTVFVDRHGKLIGEPILGMRDKEFFLNEIDKRLSLL